MIGDKSESYGKILEFISKKKSVTKKEILDYMGWGVRIAFNPYRNKLRTESNIRFTKNSLMFLLNTFKGGNYFVRLPYVVVLVARVQAKHCFCCYAGLFFGFATWTRPCCV